jgi:hypothetical protein
MNMITSTTAVIISDLKMILSGAIEVISAKTNPVINSGIFELALLRINVARISKRLVTNLEPFLPMY